MAKPEEEFEDKLEGNKSKNKGEIRRKIGGRIKVNEYPQEPGAFDISVNLCFSWSQTVFMTFSIFYL